MSVFYEGNAFIDNGQIKNVLITSSTISNSYIEIPDNTLVLNADGLISRDGGVFVTRNGGDVISDTVYTSGSLLDLLQTSFTLGSVFIDDFTGFWLQTSQGSAQISNYNGTSGSFFTIGNTLPITPSDLAFSLYAKSYIGSYYDESEDEYILGFVADIADPKISLENHGNFANLRINNLYANSTISASNIILTGDSIFNGDLLVTGSCVIEDNLIVNSVNMFPNVSDIIQEQSATLGNNVLTPTDVLNFIFDENNTRAFDATAAIEIYGSLTNQYAYYNLKGLQKNSGDWIFNTTFMGDNLGIKFTIVNGQIKYRTIDKPDFLSGVVKFRASTISL